MSLRDSCDFNSYGMLMNLRLRMVITTFFSAIMVISAKGLSFSISLAIVFFTLSCPCLRSSPVPLYYEIQVLHMFSF